MNQIQHNGRERQKRYTCSIDKKKTQDECLLYLKNPAAVLSAIKRVRPNQTPGRPTSLGAYSKTTQDIAPDPIYD